MTYSAGEILDRAFLLAEHLAGLTEATAHANGLTRPRLEVLYVLWRAGESKQADIASHIGCSARQVTALVDGLVESGHVERRVPADDRRVRLVGLTARARDILREVDAARLAAAESVFDGVDEDALQGFATVAEHMVERFTGRTITRLPGA